LQKKGGVIGLIPDQWQVRVSAYHDLGWAQLYIGVEQRGHDRRALLSALVSFPYLGIKQAKMDNRPLNPSKLNTADNFVQRWTLKVESVSHGVSYASILSPVVKAIVLKMTPAIPSVRKDRPILVRKTRGSFIANCNFIMQHLTPLQCYNSKQMSTNYISLCTAPGEDVIRRSLAREVITEEGV
jgi:hypothetical protein